MSVWTLSGALLFISACRQCEHVHCDYLMREKLTFKRSCPVINEFLFTTQLDNVNMVKVTLYCRGSQISKKVGIQLSYFYL